MDKKEIEGMAVLTVCDNYVQADIIQGNLISQGIKAEIYDTGMSAILLNEGVPVLVPEEDYERAKKIIDEPET